MQCIMIMLYDVWMDGWMIFFFLHSFCFHGLDDRHILTVAAGMDVLSMCTYYICVRTLGMYDDLLLFRNVLYCRSSHSSDW